MTAQLSDALQATVATLDVLDALELAGWKVTRHATAGVAEGTGSPIELAATVGELGPLVTSARLVGRFAHATVTVQVSARGEFLAASGTGDISENFGVDDQADARAAFDGNIDAALRLPGTWSCLIQIAWTKRLDEDAPGTQWMVFSDVAATVSYLVRQPFWSVGDVLDAGRGTVALVRELPSDSFVQAQGLTVASLRAEDVSIPDVSDFSPVPATDPLLKGSTDPRLLLPSASRGPVSVVSDALCSLTVGLVWARLATSLRVTGDGSLDAEYFGLQRVHYSLSAPGPLSDRPTAQASLDLLEWVESASTVDRLLAVRQIVSLRTDDPPWQNAGDIRAAAEPIFMALRSDAVAEALKSLRDTRASALESARQTVEVSASIAKATVERALASVIATGGIFLASTSKTLTARQDFDLRLLVAAALLGLAIWHLIVERPTLFRSIRDFREDLPTLGELLPSAETARIQELASLKNAERQATLVGRAVPAAYLALAVVAFCVKG